MNSSEDRSPVINQLQDNLYQIQVPLPRSPLRYTNAYLLTGSDRNLLIDTGYHSEPCITPIRLAFQELGQRLEITDILLTHFHDDHAGAATDLICPGRKIMYPAGEDAYFGITAREPELYKESRRIRFLSEGLTPQRFDEMMDYRRQGAAGPDFSHPALTQINPNEIIRAGAFRLQAIPTPGHTPGHMCFLDCEKNILFTGDHVLFDISSNIIFWDGIDDILQIYLDSLKKLLTLPPVQALPGHRESGDLHTRVRELLAHHEMRLDECADIIRGNPGCTSMEITSALRWRVHRRKPAGQLPITVLRYAFGECLSHLDHLVCEGRVSRRMIDGRARYYHATSLSSNSIL